MTMNERKVYAFSTQKVHRIPKELIDEAGAGASGINHLLLHRAHRRGDQLSRMGLFIDVRAASGPKDVCHGDIALNHGLFELRRAVLHDHVKAHSLRALPQ